MFHPVLDGESMLPRLLEGQCTPSYHSVKRLLDYLQKWRGYLYWLFSDKCRAADPQVVQSRVDELIKTVLLLRLVRQFDESAVLPFGELLSLCSKRKGLYDAIRTNVQGSLLMDILVPEQDDFPCWDDPEVLEVVETQATWHRRRWLGRKMVLDVMSCVGGGVAGEVCCKVVW